MNVTELSRKLKIPTKKLLEILPTAGFDIGKRAIKIDNVVANKIISNWPQILKNYNLENAPKEEKNEETEILETKKTLKIPAYITVKDLSIKMELPITKVMTELMKNGVLSSMNEKIDFDTAAIIGTDLGFEVLQEDKINNIEEQKPEKIIEDPSNLEPRPPVIVIMGHVDHGKTKLLDTIRKANVTEGEAGGITQHMGAYQITKKNRLITFIDTPGHEAFSAMRSRGARIADIAILIIAADDGIQPQTEESIKLIKSAGLPMVVAINKIDKPVANPDKIKQELAQRNLTPEEWGGKTICVPISAKQGLGIDELLDTLILLADLNRENITANPLGKTIGTVIESRIDKGEGPLATIIIQNGTLKKGDKLFMGDFYYGKVKALKDFRGQTIKEAKPSMPVKILGLKAVPSIGDMIKTGETIERKYKIKNYQLKNQAAAAYTSLLIKKKESKKRPAINLILKADVLGSLEALIASIDKFERPDIEIKIISKGLGSINESDVILAEDNKALLLGFHVNPTPAAFNMAQEKNIEIKTYKIIYELLDEVKKQFENMIKPEIVRTDLGRLKILAIFRKEKNSQIIGGKVTKGKIIPNAKADVIRNDQKITSGEITQLQANKVDVNEVILGHECGLKFKGKPIIQEGDLLEAYKEETIKNKIDF